MTHMQHFSNTNLRQILLDNDISLANNYVSQNIAIARDVQSAIISESIGHGPFIMEEMRILILKRGSARPVLNLVEQQFQALDVIFLGAKGIVHFKDISPDIQGIGLSLSDDLFSMAVGNQIPKAFDGHLRHFKVHISESEMAFLDNLHRMIGESVKQDGHTPQVTLRLVSAFLWQVDYLFGKQEQLENSHLSREQRVFTDFINLVSQYATLHHEIEFYADKLCLSPRYVGNLVKRASGKSAKQWIDDAIVTRIKIELHHSDKQIQQIADEMNFTNSSFFTKFFRRMTGMTPIEFRFKG